MRNLACLFALALCGCGTVAPGVEVETIYRAPLFGQGIGDVKRVEDKQHGVILYYAVGKQGDVLLYSIRVDGK